MPTGDLYTTEIACTIDRMGENDRQPSFVARGGEREYTTIQDALDAVSEDAISDLRAASGQSRASFG